MTRVRQPTRRHRRGGPRLDTCQTRLDTQCPCGAGTGGGGAGSGGGGGGAGGGALGRPVQPARMACRAHGRPRGRWEHVRGRLRVRARRMRRPSVLLAPRWPWPSLLQRRDHLLPLRLLRLRLPPLLLFLLPLLLLHTLGVIRADEPRDVLRVRQAAQREVGRALHHLGRYRGDTAEIQRRFGAAGKFAARSIPCQYIFGRRHLCQVSAGGVRVRCRTGRPAAAHLA